jgi:hypothetical protein
MSIEKIKQLVEQFIINVNDGIQDNIQKESIDQYHASVYTSYSVQDDIEKLLLKVGVILDNKILIDAYKKPKTIEEIVAEIEKHTSFTSSIYFSDFEELEEVEDIIDANSDLECVSINEIIKHIPTGKFYQFSRQKSGEFYGKPEFIGEVIQKQITTTQWVKN